MGTSNNTLRSQTVRCPHCGEYYSVTYKYCPFCDAGRQEEERRQAAKKKKKQALFSSLFGGDSEKKKGSKDSRRDSEHTERTRRERPAREESAGRSAGTSKDQREHPAKDHGSRDHSSKGHSAKETAAKDPLLTTRRHGHRKKTSEMTPEERAASLAEREARAAARKRERDRLAREAALNALETTPAQDQADAAPVELPVVDGVSPQETPVEAGPVFEEVTVPETFGYGEETTGQTPAAPAQAGQEGMSQTMIFIPPIPAAQEEQAQKAPEAEETVWDSVKDLEDAADVPEIAAIPTAVQEQATQVQVGEGVQPEQPQPAPAPQQAAPAEPAVETEEDLDALLSEIRDLLAESPVPSLDAQQIEKPAAPVEEVQLQQEPEGQEAPAAPAQEVPAQEGVPVVDEPTIALDPLSPTEEVQADGQEEVPADAVDTAPTQVIPSQAIEEELAAQTEKGWAEEELPAAVRPPRQAAAQEEAARREDHRSGRKEKKKKSGRGNLVLLVISLIIVVAAVFIVVRTVVPAFQNGIFSGSTQAAESVTLDRTTLDLAEAGTTIALVPTFAPEGATAALTWTSSDEAVATVDENGNVTAVAPGSAVITAAMENGQKAECTVNCTWDAEAQAPEEGGEGQETAPAGPSLSSNDITLDSAGATKQLTLNGASGEVTWTSSDEAVATVAADGTVTAVAPGRATVTATVGEQTFNCTIRCIW